jgi:hypothetical protein
MPRRDLRALGRSRGHKKRMTKVERDYADALELGRMVREIQWFAFEAIKLRLADATFLEPDFFVQRANGELECHEVKASKSDGSALWEEDARVKIKIAATLYPFRFYGVHLRDGAWSLEEFPP